MDKEQISNEEESEFNSTDVQTSETLEKEETACLSSLFLHVESYSKTQPKSVTIEYTWIINRFGYLSKFLNTIRSPPFPETNRYGQYKIQINILRQPVMPVITCYMRTSTHFEAACITSITYPLKKVISSQCIRGVISDMTLLHEISNFEECYGPLIVRCKLEIFTGLTNNTIHLNLLPLSSTYKDVKASEDLTSESESTNEESIKFIIEQEQFVIPKKLLCATNSSYFKNICLTHENKEKDMTDELISYMEVQTFKQMLLFILSDSIDQNLHDYKMLKELLITADKYDVLALKLMCEHYLLRDLTMENAAELLQLAFSCDAKFLEKNLRIFIKFHIKEMVHIKKFQELLQTDFNKVWNSLKKIKISENIVFANSSKK